MGHISTCESRLPIETINTEFKECIALWDSGSAINLVDNQWARHNGIEGKPCKLKFKVVDGTVKEIESKAYNIGLIDAHGKSTKILAYGIEELASKASPLGRNI